MDLEQSKYQVSRFRHRYGVTADAVHRVASGVSAFTVARKTSGTS